jgi:hypothetical protein
VANTTAECCGTLGTRIDHIGNPFGQIAIWSSM